MRIAAYCFVAIFLCSCAKQPSKLPNSLPQAQMGHTIVHDENDNRLLFGGFADETIFSKVWGSSEQNWQVIDNATPVADRTWYSVTPFIGKNESLVFGGKTMNREPLDETWIWKDSTWRRYEGPGPSARSHHTAVFDRARNVIVLFGGDNNDTLLNDVWEWNGVSWQEINAQGPAIRAAHMSGYDPQRKLVIIAGGVAPDNETRLQDVWGWNGEKWQRLPELPSPRALGAASGDNDGVVLFGGWRDGFKPVSETLRLTSEGWQIIDGSGPPPTAAATLSWDEDGDVMILSGGMDDAFQALDDIWVLEDARWRRVGVEEQ